MTMKYRKLGNSGLSVSNLILGTMGFGTETPEEETVAILDAFLEAGGNMIDTADVYGGGASEKLLGRWRASRPDSTSRLIVATKARFGTGPDVNDAGTSRPHLHRALNTSLRRLGVEAIDLYQMHGWDPFTPVEETLSFLDAAVRAGKIHYVGLSNFTGWQLQLVLSPARAPWAFRCRSRCSSNTAWRAGRSNMRSFPPLCIARSACCPGRRWRGAS